MTNDNAECALPGGFKDCVYFYSSALKFHILSRVQKPRSYTVEQAYQGASVRGPIVAYKSPVFFISSPKIISPVL